MQTPSAAGLSALDEVSVLEAVRAARFSPQEHMKPISNEVTIQAKVDDGNVTIKAQTSRFVAGPAAGVARLQIQIYGIKDDEKKRKLVDEHMPAIKRLTSQSPFTEPSVDVNDNDKTIFLHWDDNDVAMRLPLGNPIKDQKAVEASLRAGPLVNTSKKITIQRIADDKFTIEAQAKRLVTGPLTGLQCIAVRATGFKPHHGEHRTKLVHQYILDVMPTIKEKTKQCALPIHLNDTDNPASVHWDNDDITMLTSCPDHQMGDRNAVEASLRAAPLEDISKKITIPTPVNNGTVKIEAQAKRLLAGPLKKLEFIALRIVGLQEEDAQDKRKRVDEYVLDKMPTIKQMLKESALKDEKCQQSDGNGQWNDYDISIPEWDDDDISIPDKIEDENRDSFAAFVSWIRKNYYAFGSNLDPGNVQNMKPTSAQEATFLNFLMFYDKYYSTRTPFKCAQQYKHQHPENLAAPGTDIDFHWLARIYVQYGSDYFMDNTDVKGKTQEELQSLRERPWRPYPSGGDSDIDSD